MKNLAQTTILVFLTLLLISTPLHAQWDFWSAPEPITDSVSDNQNPVIQQLDFIENDFYIFWENSTDSLSTAIHYKKFYSDDEPQVFLSGDGVHFQNPHFIEAWYFTGYPDTSFYIFYESDETGTNRIYYRVHNTDGFTDPSQLTTSGERQTEMLCNNTGRVVWMEQNRVMHTVQDKNTMDFEDPVILDSGNCSFPSITQIDNDWGMPGLPVVAWIKEENDSAKIMLRRYNQQEGWQEADTLFTGSQCTNLSFCNGIDTPGILIWDYFNDTSWQVLYYDIDSEQLYHTEFVQETPLQPYFYSGFIPLKSRYIESGFTSFAYQKNDTNDVFISDFFRFNPPIEAYQNISESGSLVNKPQVFTGKLENPCIKQFFINVWEEWVNNHWQLKYAENFQCLSGIEEEHEAAIPLTASPNPFPDEIEIAFSLDEAAEVLLSIYNANGKQLETLASGKLEAGQHLYKWDGKLFKAGLYFVSLQINSKRVTQKIILTN